MPTQTDTRSEPSRSEITPSESHSKFTLFRENLGHLVANASACGPHGTLGKEIQLLASLEDPKTTSEAAPPKTFSSGPPRFC